MREYADPHAKWQYLGKTPLEDLRLPWAQCVLKFVKDGYEPLEVASEYVPAPNSKFFVLDPIGSLPKSMVHVPPGEANANGLAQIHVDGFIIDKYEVTNLEFKRFVDAGGYRELKYWKFPFIKEGQTLTFDQAMVQFVDKTDRPAHSTWNLGNFLAGRENYPVDGLSWYEAAAYAQFVGKSLPCTTGSGPPLWDGSPTSLTPAIFLEMVPLRSVASPGLDPTVRWTWPAT
jgi:eukaryotic-like serine/threonine-protein kinase